MKSKPSSLYWCKNCGVPLLKKTCENCGYDGHKICSDLKPMFKEECEFLERETGKKLPGKGWQDGLWMRYKTIWFNGRRLFRLSANGKPVIIKEYRFSDNSDQPDRRPTKEILYRANKSTLDVIEHEAVYFIQQIVKEYPERKPVVSFSGGKDSTVVSYLVRKALGINEISHMFSDTTMEYPDTHEYIKRFSGNNGGIPFYQRSGKNDFLEMCKLIGPPSRINAWCCTVFKASPIANMVSNINDKGGVISFEGIRKRESHRRRDREKTYMNKKIVHQLSVYPILDWKEIEIWLFILAKGLDFNNAYKRGFPRVGCMYCPNNISYNEHLLKIIYPAKIQKWEDFLLNYAKKIGKEDPSDYVSSGAWKMRVGKSEGQSLAYVTKSPCLKNLNAMHFILDKEIRGNFEDFIERFKPFGRIETFSDSHGDEGFIVKNSDTNEGIFMIKRVKNIEVLKRESKIEPNWELGIKEFLCVDLLITNGKYHLFQSIERQMRKFQVCTLCGSCTGICPTSAISISPHFKIHVDKCINCGRCISSKYIPFGCITLNSVRQGKDFRNVDRN